MKISFQKNCNCAKRRNLYERGAVNQCKENETDRKSVVEKQKEGVEVQWGVVVGVTAG